LSLSLQCIGGLFRLQCQTGTYSCLYSYVELPRVDIRRPLREGLDLNFKITKKSSFIIGSVR
jgi:hypothetical protein